jgi:hypothetical protein
LRRLPVVEKRSVTRKQEISLALAAIAIMLLIGGLILWRFVTTVAVH